MLPIIKFICQSFKKYMYLNTIVRGFLDLSKNFNDLLICINTPAMPVQRMKKITRM